MWSSSPSRLQMLPRRLEHLVVTFTSALDGWRHGDLRLNTDALRV
jgi:hypothetical protein